MILIRLIIIVVLANLFLRCASTPPTPIDSGVKQVEKGLAAAKSLPANTPGAGAITSALEQCRANLPAYEAVVNDLKGKLEKCEASRLSLSKSAGKGDGYSTLLWMAFAAAVGFFIKWLIGHFWGGK